MKIKSDIFLKIVILAIFASIFISSCQSKPAGILSTSKMEDILVDMYVLEGTLSVAGEEYNNPIEKEKYYKAFLEKHKVTSAQFDSSLSWYTKNPKYFERIYTNVNAKIDEKSKEIKQGKYHPVDSNALTETNIWNLRTKYVLTKDSARTKIKFDIKSNGFLPGDYYNLSLLHRIAPTDTTSNPHIVMYVNYWDGSIDSIYAKTHNDNYTRRYKLMFKARLNKKIKSVSGMLLGSNSVRGKMNVYLDSIKLIRKYNQFKQDSIRDMIDFMDTTVVPVDTTVSKRIPKPAALPAQKSWLEKKPMQH